MVEVKGKTATEVMKKSIDYVIKYGTKREVYGGTIPKDIKDPRSPNDFDRIMIEADPGMTMVLTDPLARWTDYSNQWVGISLREQEDHFQVFNPGYVIKYSKLYPRWLKDNFFNYTYGERFFAYPFALNQKSGEIKKVGWQFNQIEAVIKTLEKHPTTRKACISTWYPSNDLGDPYVPCNCFMQIRIVDGKIDWTTVVRSLDVLRGFSENLFMFSLWQEYVAKKLNVPLGKYITVALNAHLYDEQIKAEYHNQKIPDCYKFYKPKPAFETDFPAFQMKFIDESLFAKGEKSFDSAFRLAKKLPEYWRNWKLALISEWERLQGRYDNALEAYYKIDNEFKFSVARRLMKQKPECIDLLPWKEQQDFLKY